MARADPRQLLVLSRPLCLRPPPLFYHVSSARASRDAARGSHHTASRRRCAATARLPLLPLQLPPVYAAMQNKVSTEPRTGYGCLGT